VEKVTPTKAKLDACQACGLCRTATQSVPGIGNQNRPLIAAVGEGPGADEDREAVPFIGPAGQELQDIVANVLGLTLNDLYVTNIVKHRPPQNRTPTSTEAEACWDAWLKDELAAVQPYVIVALGRCAGENLLRRANIPVTKQRLRGTVSEYNGTPVFHCWHPSYVIRQKSVSEAAYQKARSELIADLTAALKVATTLRSRYTGQTADAVSA